jgi:hypothetical protein
MHSAPSVTYPVGRSRFALAFVVLAWLAGAAGVAAWRIGVAAPALQVFAAVAAVVAFGAAALHGWLRSPAGTLSWDGAGWTWSGPAGAESGSPRTVLDAQRVMLLRWDCGRTTRWLWLERAMQPSSWDDLRRAVYSRVPTP